MRHKIGDDIYIPSAMYISRGSDDRIGGLAKIIKINDESITVDTFPHISFGYQNLLSKQEELKKQFGNNRAYPDPDIDTPFIEKGDIVNGKVYNGNPIW